MTTLERLQTYQQNLRIAVAIEQAERVIEQLMKKAVVVSGMDIGRYQCPVIRVHYSPACDALVASGAATVPDRDLRLCTVSVKYHGCIVQWEQPYTATMVH